ncbi:MAG: radical SAM protein [Treponemataceae bacterium]
MFKPEEIIFAPTGRCNLSCAHCRVPRVPGPLSADDAISLLRSVREHGVDRVGFSGGEPFLEMDFLCGVTKAAVELDFIFDRAMTNADWWRDETDLRRSLNALFDAGFDGKFGVSVDTYHAQDLSRLVVFFNAVFDIWGRRDCCEIVWTTSPDDSGLLNKFGILADALNGELVLEDGRPLVINGNNSNGDDPDAAPDDEYSEESGFDDPNALSILFDRILFSPSAEEAAWSDANWFTDDFCAGPGNVFYVHPDGRIAVCCGFANESDALVVGKLGTDDFESLMRNAGTSAYVRICYEKGLGAERLRLENSGTRFPGKTADLCVFCDYLCKKGFIG